MTTAVQNLVGKRFSRWTVLANAGRDKSGLAIWRVKCDCGKEADIRGYNLQVGYSKCCRKCAAFVKGCSRYREYGVWRGMIQRTSPAATGNSKINYYDRGIRACSRWIGPDGFFNFLADMGRRPSDRHQLDRIDNDGNCEPSNCRWATREENQSNKRKNNYLRNASDHDLVGEALRRGFIIYKQDRNN